MRIVDRRHLFNGKLASRLETENPRYVSFGQQKVLVHDNDVVVCMGKDLYETDHYEPQPFYKVLTTRGQIAYVSKGNRNKYFELVR